jgi:hypothetical protein
LDTAIGPQLRAFSPKAYESAVGWIFGGPEGHSSFNRHPDDPLFEQRFVLTWLWNHTTNNGQEPWLFCNSQNAASLPDDDENYDTCVFRSYTGYLDVYNEVNATLWLSNAHECTWPGKYCTGEMVSEITLHDMNLQGEFIPPFELQQASRRTSR